MVSVFINFINVSCLEMKSWEMSVKMIGQSTKNTRASKRGKGNGKGWRFKKMCQIQYSWLTLFILCMYFSVINSFMLDSIPTLNKCCPQGTLYSLSTFECVEIVQVKKLQARNQNVKPKNESQTLIEDSTEIPTTTITSTISDSVYNSEDFTTSDVLSVSKSSLLHVHENDIDMENSSSFSEDFFEFKLVPRAQAPKCSKGNFTVQINIRNLQTQLRNQNENNTSANLTIPDESQDIAQLTSMGLLKIGMEYYSIPEYCLAGLEGDTLSILVCNATCGAGTPCIRKCCDLNEVWDQNRGRRQRCLPAGPKKWHPVLYTNYKQKASQEMLESLHIHYQILHPKQFCNTAMYKPTVVEQIDSDGHPHSKFRILTNGEVLRRMTRYHWSDSFENRDFYCVDGGINSRYPFQNQDPVNSYSGNDERDSIYFDCGPELPEDDTKSQTLLYAVVMIFSCIFLLLTILVYVLLWEKQRVHGWTLMCYSTSLFFMYLFFVLMYFSQLTMLQRQDGKADAFCHFVGVGLNFFFLSTFCWMSMVNFDLFTTFKALKPTAGRSKGFKRFLAYACFSLGVPTCIVAVALSLDSVYGFNADSGIVVPEYGRRQCQLDPEYAQLVYAYGPAGVLLGFNIIFFTVTLYTMYKIQQSTKFATSSSSKNSQQKQSMGLFAKLLFVMGIPWIFEVISWAVEHNRISGTSWYWIVFDLINILQAMAIFYIFVCKQDIIHSLEQKYPPIKKFLDRILMDSETADRIKGNYPKLRGFLKPITRRTQDVTSMGRSSQTEMTTTTNSVHSSHPESLKKDDNIHLQTRKPSQQKPPVNIPIKS